MALTLKQRFIRFIISKLAQDSIEEIEDGRTTAPEVAKLCRRAAAESCVLLKNEGVLPITNENLAVFGRCQANYFYVGYGSGGDVKAPYKVSLIEGLHNSGMTINKQLEETYQTWIDKNPPDDGFWGAWPMSYDEMPLTEEQVKQAAAESEVALVVIGRSSGEDRESKLEPGSWYLTQEEEDMLAKVSKEFSRVCVLLNTGSVMDLTWVEKYKIGSVLLAWQGGQESGNGVADVLTGKVNPCGKLSDTVAPVDKYPSTEQFGGKKFSNYTEDIYVGYRYFETFDTDSVIYPFGYGLSYTTFETTGEVVSGEGEQIVIHATVKNTGNVPGREVVQLYYQAPMGKLGKPARELGAFAKTKVLEPQEEQQLELTMNQSVMASFDDTGVSGYLNAFVLEEGNYNYYLGGSVRDAKKIGSMKLEETQLVEQLSEALPVNDPFQRLVAHQNGEQAVAAYETTPAATRNLRQRILANLPEEITPTGDQGIKLTDVAEGKASLEAFVAQLSEEELETLTRGDLANMNSPLGPVGNAGTFAGTSESLRAKGVPAICTNDGPSGARLQAHSTLFPIGIGLACTFDTQLIQQLGHALGQEVEERDSHVLLAPGMNIHRHPLCGRNFEYFSEDPVLTGKMAAAYVCGVQSTKTSAVPKHFACNNQETKRNTMDARVSPRALREIYLKGFEICVKEAHPDFLMTSYNKINGSWNYYNYDLTTMILRKEWGFDSCLMTDWWMQNGESEDFKNLTTQAWRVRSQTDIFMPGSANFGKMKGKVDGTLLSSYHSEDGITLGEMQRSAMNVLKYCVKRMQNQ